MPASAVIGLQWGDEGKGKVVDLLAKENDLTVRFNGGNNAGHTVIINGKKSILHHLPSGILSPKVKSLIANSVVVDLKILLEEISNLQNEGIKINEDNLFISEQVHLIMPYHRQIDKLRESNKNGIKLGTTSRGIGPVYEDKVSRSGIRLIDLFEPQYFKKRLENIIGEKNSLISNYYGEDPLLIDDIFHEYLEYAEGIKRFVTDTRVIVDEYLISNKKVLFEGAQGILLDIDHGSYPFVTSSNSVTGSIFSGCGIGPINLDRIIGVVKSYTTRVGTGPFPTEMKGSEGERLRGFGMEYGSTTGRPRRCGWLDLALIKHSLKLTGATELALTKLDVLSNFSIINVCHSYENWKNLYLPASLSSYENLKPEYFEMPGWSSDISKAKKFDDLPKEARNFINRIEEICEKPITIISVGSDREETITR